VDIVAGDVLDADSLRPALDGVGAAYYLVHSMAAGPGFARRDREAATCSAARVGVVDFVLARVS
jgi:uncharacterized protein YbjT (DUF2867 family)